MCVGWMDLSVWCTGKFGEEIKKKTFISKHVVMLPQYMLRVQWTHTVCKKANFFIVNFIHTGQLQLT